MWYYVVIGIVILLLFVLYILIYSVFNYVFKRRKGDNDWTQESYYSSDSKELKEGPYGPFNEQIIPGIIWMFKHEHKEIKIKSFDDLTLYGRIYEHENPKGIIVLVHGYHSWSALDFSASANIFFDKGYSLLLIDQRTHNNSEGKYITFGIKERYDIKAWTDEISKIYPNLPIALCGMSMGAATVMMASSLELNTNVKAIIADCGFTTPKDIFASVIHNRSLFLTKPIIAITNLIAKKCIGISFTDCDTRVELTKNRLPILLIHGKNDTFVPCYMTQENYKVAKEYCNASLLLVDDADHGQSFLYNTDEYLKKVDDLLNSYLIHNQNM